MKDKQGREYAKLSELKVGETIEVDRTFDGVEKYRLVLEDSGRLWVLDNAGRHFLDGELMPDGDSLVGVYKLPMSDFNPEIAA
jgi:hypothetical protein